MSDEIETKDEEVQEEVVETQLDIANNIVKNYSLGSMGVGLIPIPILDMAGLTGVQLKMLHSLAGQYEVPFSKDLAKSIIASLLGGLLPVGAAKWGASSLAKFIPVGGIAIGMISMAVFGGAATYAVGKVFIQHFESGGTFLDFDPNTVKEHFAAEFEKGKAQVKSHYNSEEPSTIS